MGYNRVFLKYTYLQGHMERRNSILELGHTFHIEEIVKVNRYLLIGLLITNTRDGMRLMNGSRLMV